MEVKFVEDEGGLGATEGFTEAHEGLKTRFVRVPNASLRLEIAAPKIIKVISYRALKDARRTKSTPSFPSQQCSNDLERSIVTVLSGTARVSGLGARQRTTMSTLGGLNDLATMEVRFQSARLEDSEEITGFTVDWFSAEYVRPNGGFILNGRIAEQDIDLIAEELRASSGQLEITLNIGLFPGFFGEWSFDGWDGGKLKFANQEICSRVVSNYDEIPEDFFNPEQPFDTRIDTIGPHELISFQIISN